MKEWTRADRLGCLAWSLALLVPLGCWVVQRFCGCGP